MATKFITIRIPICYLRLNRTVEKEASYVASDDFAVRLLEIQTRISALKSRFGWREKSNKNTQTQSKPVVDTKAQQQREDSVVSRNAELEDLKAKLLGKKR